MNSRLAAAVLSGFSLALVACSSTGPQLPDAQALIQGHLDAAYNGKPLEAHPAMSFEGRLVIESFQVDAPLALKTEAPDKRYFETVVNGEKITRACAAGQCWSRQYGQFQQAQGGRRAFLAEVADYFRLQNLQRYFARVETRRLTTFNDEAAYEVLLTRPNGVEEQWYFSRATGLWLGGSWSLPQEMGGSKVTQYFEGYKPFGELKVATEITEVSPEQTSKVIIEKVSFQDIPDRIFQANAEERAAFE